MGYQIYEGNAVKERHLKLPPLVDLPVFQLFLCRKTLFLPDRHKINSSMSVMLPSLNDESHGKARRKPFVL